MTKSSIPDTDAAGAVQTQLFRLLKTETARKLGKNADGGITYRILTDPEHKQLYLAITGNAGGGYFSKETIAFSGVEKCLAQRPAKDKPFSSKIFKDAFVGRSSNNAGFMAAILRHEGLLASAPEVETQHLVAGDWTAWQADQLKLPGDPLDLNGPTSLSDGASNAPENTDVPSEKNSEPSPSNAPSKMAMTHRRNA